MEYISCDLFFNSTVSSVFDSIFSFSNSCYLVNGVFIFVMFRNSMLMIRHQRACYMEQLVPCQRADEQI